MALGSGSRVQLAYLPEVTRGTTPGSGTPKYLRAVQRAINPSKNILTSDEVRPSGQTADQRHGFTQVVGTYQARLAPVDYDEWLELVLRSTWATITISSTGNITPSAVDNSYTRASGSWITDGVRPGDILTAASFTDGANNGLKRIVTVSSATKIIVAETLVTHAAEAGTLTFPGKRLSMGTDLKTWSVERRFEDTSRFQRFRGVCPNATQFSVTPEALASLSSSLLGMFADSMTSAHTLPDGSPTTPAAAGTADAYAAFDGELYVGSSVVAIATSLSLNINNNRSLAPVIGSKFSPDVFDGTNQTTGQLVMYMDDAAVNLQAYTVYLNEQTTSLWLRLKSADGNSWMNCVLPKVKFNSDDIDPAQQGPVPQQIGIGALEDSYGSTIRIQRSNA